MDEEILNDIANGIHKLTEGAEGSPIGLHAEAIYTGLHEVADAIKGLTSYLAQKGEG